MSQEGAVANSRFEPISRIFRPLCTAVFRMHVAEIRYLQQHPGEVLTVKHLGLHVPEEVLHHRIVIAVARARHRLHARAPGNETAPGGVLGLRSCSARSSLNETVESPTPVWQASMASVSTPVASMPSMTSAGDNAPGARPSASKSTSSMTRSMLSRHLTALGCGFT